MYKYVFILDVMLDEVYLIWLSVNIGKKMNNMLIFVVFLIDDWDIICLFFDLIDV